MSTHDGAYRRLSALVAGFQRNGPTWPSPPQRSERELSFRNVSAYMSFAEAHGKPYPAEHLLTAFRRYDRAKTFRSLANLAAALANDVPLDLTQRARELVVEPLERLARDVNPWLARTADYVRSQSSGRAILNEKVIYVLQALVLAEGCDGGVEPSEQELAFHILAANDYIDRWRSPAEPLDEASQMLASFTHHARFNRGGDLLRDVVRTAIMLRDGPPNARPLSNPNEWKRFQSEALGSSFEEYFESFMGVLAMLAGSWGRREEDGKWVAPSLNFSTWPLFSGTNEQLALERLRDLTSTLDEARASFNNERCRDGIPYSPILFYEKPFVQTSEDVVIPASPWVIREQLHYGIWKRFIETSKRLYKQQADRWLSAFGEMFEEWCRRVAKEAASCPGFRGRLLLSKTIGGPDEIEDIVVVEGDAVILFSCKGSLLTKDVKMATSQSDVVQRLERFFFTLASGRHNDGAIRLLDKKAQRIRAGNYKDAIPRNGRIYPVIVTYEHMGENLVMYDWLKKSSAEKRLFQQPNVAHPTLIWVGDYELLMSVAAHGASISEILDRRTTVEGGLSTLEAIIETTVPASQHRRLPQIERDFDEVVERIRRRLNFEAVSRMRAPKETQERVELSLESRRER